MYWGCHLGVKYAFKRFEENRLRGMLREIRALKTAWHPNITNVIGTCEEERCLISEFVEGETLKDSLKKGPNHLSWERKRTIIQKVVQALIFFHDKHILHLDLKPENILLGVKGEVKLCDMGMSRMVDGPDWPKKGSVEYNSPERSGFVPSGKSGISVFSRGSLSGITIG